MRGARSKVNPGEPTNEDAARAVREFIPGDVRDLSAHTEDDERSIVLVESGIYCQRISTKNDLVIPFTETAPFPVPSSARHFAST
jgi:hypothetical protein